MKRTLSIISITVLCLAMILTSIPFATAVSKPKAPTEFKVNYYSYYGESLSLTMNIVKDVEGYEIKAYNSKGKCVTTATAPQYNNLKTATVRVLNIKPNNFYKLTARSYIKSNGKKVFSSYSKPIYVCQEVKANLFYSSKGYFTLGWAKVKGAKNYTVYVKPEKGEFHKVKTTTSNQIKVKKVNGKKIKAGYYDIKVIAQKKVGGKTYKSDEQVYSVYFSNKG